jgi:hypothetical protein
MSVITNSANFSRLTYLFDQSHQTPVIILKKTLNRSGDGRVSFARNTFFNQRSRLDELARI